MKLRSDRLLFKDGKPKAVTLSYDDGSIHDRRLIKLFNEYGVKGTFNLNAGLFIKKHPQAEEVREIYAGHEIGGHGLLHSTLAGLGPVAMYEILEDRKRLEQATGQFIRTFAYPSVFDDTEVYDDDVKEMLRLAGYASARTADCHGSFTLPKDLFAWAPTCHHDDPRLMELAKEFCEQSHNGPVLFYVYGHSFEFNRKDNWHVIEELVKYLSDFEFDIWFAANGEIADYLDASRRLYFSADGNKIGNPSGMDVWREVKGQCVKIPAGASRRVNRKAVVKKGEENQVSLEIAVVSQGTLRGVAHPGYSVFKGVPFAAPPTGDLRFRPPQAAASWEGVRLCDTFPAVCPQEEFKPDSFYYKEFYSDLENRPTMSEDCLYLNIWTPANRTDEKLPVAVWFHGGGFRRGYPHEVEFDGEELNRRGVILVTTAYRLGVFGFLAHPALLTESAGNYGFLDQVAAIKWVHKNIGAFGGDPDNITVFGQSAGAMSTQFLVSSPLTQGLIAKAILQSGGGCRCPMQSGLTIEDAAIFGRQAAKELGISTASQLWDLTWQEVLQLDKGTKPQGTRFRFMPCIGGGGIPLSCDEALDSGAIADIPYMIGSTKDDFGGGGALHESAKAMSFKLRELGRSPAYVYRFDRDLPGDDAGAFHSSELWYTFGTLGRCWRPMTPEDYFLSKRMLDAWALFMKTGSPGWAPCTTENPHVEIFNIRDHENDLQ